MASKRNCARRNKTALGPRGQAETSLKIEDLRYNKTTDKFGTFGYYNDLPVIQPALIIFVIEECILILILTINFF
jgi:hypothetical protein